jgi:hypothetical protein
MGHFNDSQMGVRLPEMAVRKPFMGRALAPSAVDLGIF